MRRRFVLVFVLLAAFAMLVGAGLYKWRSSRPPPDYLPAYARTLALPKLAAITPPALPPHDFTTRNDVTAWQGATRAALQRRFALPNVAAATTVTAHGELAAPAGLVRRMLVFAGAGGSPIPAVLQYRVGGGKRPGILVIPGHTLSRTDSGLRQLVDGEDTYQAAAATALAQAGFVTLAFELRGFGLLGAPLDVDEFQVAYNALLAGSFYKALVIEDAMRALELLRSTAPTDGSRIGVTGASLGGELAVALAALDPSIEAIAFSSYGGSAGPFPAQLEPDEKTPMHYCHIIPGAWHFLRQEDAVLLLAPRPVLRGARRTG